MGQGWCVFSWRLVCCLFLVYFTWEPLIRYITCMLSLMFILLSFWLVKAWFPGGSVGKASAPNVGPWFDPWDGKIPGEGNHSSTLALKIPWIEEPRGLQSMESQRVGHDWATSFYLWLAHRFVVSTQLKVVCGCRRAERSYSTFKVRRGGSDEIPLVQGKGQW